MAATTDEILALLEREIKESEINGLEAKLNAAIDAQDQPEPAGSGFSIKMPDSAEEMKVVPSAEKKMRTKKFGSAEHVKLGDEAFESFLANNTTFRKELGGRGIRVRGGNIRISDDKIYSPGQISALAGDFFGRAGKPISQEPSLLTDSTLRDELRESKNSLTKRKHRFKKALRTFLEADVKEIQAILAVMNQEGKILERALASDEDPAVALEAGEWKRNVKYYHCSANYLSLSQDNRDHFSPDNRLVYEAGHELAIEKARSAFKNPHDDRKTSLLTEALLTELYAMHFEQDLFSSGHMRVPRQELEESVDYKLLPRGVVKKLGGLFSKKMHDEDSQLGVEVTNARGETWVAFGDEHLFSKRNERSKNMALEALKASFNDILLAYKGKDPEYQYRAFWPQVKAKEVVEHQPLFIVEKNDVGEPVVKRRRSIEHSKTKEYIADWNCFWTLIKTADKVHHVAQAATKDSSSEETSSSSEDEQSTPKP